MPASTKRSAAKKPAAKSPAKPAQKTAQKPAAKGGLGKLPEWNLADLYAGIDDPRGEARPRPRRRRLRSPSRRPTRASSRRSRTDPTPGAKLAEAVKRYEALDDLLGRLSSFAGLIHAGNTVDPARAKFYGDVQERITAASIASAVLRARAQPDRRREARSRDGRSGARPLPAVDRGHAQGEALSARGPHRAIVPREVGDRPTRPGTGCSTRRSRACASRSTARRWRSSRRST